MVIKKVDCIKKMAYKSYRVKKPDMPLISYMEQASFKLFMLDIGLLAAKANLSAKTLLEGSRIFTEFKGALTEQFVAPFFYCELCRKSV